MTFLEQLQSHKGGLLRIKSELFWYGGRGWDRSPGRVCLILDAATAAARTAAAVATAARAAARAAHAAGATAAHPAAVLLLIDDHPQWVWVSQQDVEIL